MANHDSAKKRARQTERRNARNRTARSTCRSTVKSTREAIAAADINKAADLLKSAEKTLASAAGKHLYHKKNASRKVSRLAKALNKAKAQSKA